MKLFHQPEASESHSFSTLYFHISPSNVNESNLHSKQKSTQRQQLIMKGRKKNLKKKNRNKNFPSWITKPSTSPHMFDSNNILLADNCLQLERYIFGGNNPEKHSTKLMIIWLHSPYLEHISTFTPVYKYINCHLPSSEKKSERGGSDGREGKELPIRPKACQNPVSEGNETKCGE